jgi:hypothetical protein
VYSSIAPLLWTERDGTLITIVATSEDAKNG